MSNPIAGLFTWKLHGDGKTLKPGEVVEPDERLTWPRTAEIGAQHVIAMFGATFLVPILTGFDPSTTLFFTAMSTALFLLINKNMLPSYLLVLRLHRPDRGRRQRPQGPRRRILRHHGHRHPAGPDRCARPLRGRKWIDIIMPPVVNGAIVAIIGFNLLRACGTTSKSLPTPPSSPSSRCCSSQCCSRVCSADSTSSSA